MAVDGMSKLLRPHGKHCGGDNPLHAVLLCFIAARLLVPGDPTMHTIGVDVMYFVYMFYNQKETRPRVNELVAKVSSLSRFQTSHFFPSLSLISKFCFSITG